jgi:hypothetical protein
MLSTRFSIRPRHIWLHLAFALLGSTLLGGCGKPATVEDCERIVVRMAELELAANSVSDPVQVREQVAATRESFRTRALTECVGRNIPASAMECIGRATSTDQILSECLD